jgi:hypothetical protein
MNEDQILYAKMCRLLSQLQAVKIHKDIMLRIEHGDRYVLEKEDEIRIAGLSADMHADHVTWLPNLDYLQTLLPGVTGHEAVMYLYKTCVNGSKYFSQFKTLEQLMLACAAKEKWDKKWNGEAWEEWKIDSFKVIVVESGAGVGPRYVVGKEVDVASYMLAFHKPWVGTLTADQFKERKDRNSVIVVGEAQLYYLVNIKHGDLGSVIEDWGPDKEALQQRAHRITKELPGCVGLVITGAKLEKETEPKMANAREEYLNLYKKLHNGKS